MNDWTTSDFKKRDTVLVYLFILGTLSTQQLTSAAKLFQRYLLNEFQANVYT